MDALSLEDLVQGRNEWSNIPDILRATLRVFHDSIVQVDAKIDLDVINEALSKKANKDSVAAALHKKANRTEVHSELEQIHRALAECQRQVGATSQKVTRLETVVDSLDIPSLRKGVVGCVHYPGVALFWLTLL
jgi:hypothetical protein